MSTLDSDTLYDLHSHSLASDGLLTPAELVARAAQMRVGVLALTDHDTVAGIAPAQQAIAQQALTLHLIPGVEISTSWENHEIHIVGLGLDPNAAAIQTLLRSQSESRLYRAGMIASRLEKAQIFGALEGVAKLAAGGAITRGHFARFLIEQNIAANMSQVFKNYLARGKTGYVPPQWCTMKQAIDAIHHSGGKSVLAHPGRYNLSTKWLKRLIVSFKQEGGSAMEVAQCQQAPAERSQLGQYARDHDLAASQGSDFHQPCAWIELGKKLWLPAGVEAIWKRYPELQSHVGLAFQEEK